MFANLLESIERLEKLDALIQLEKTGTPFDAAEKLDISERQFYRLISFMKNLGAEIKYCKIKQTYVYTEPVQFHFGFIFQN